MDEYDETDELTVDSAELAAREIRHEERRHVLRRHFLDLPSPTAWARAEDLLPSGFATRMSMSLAMGLTAYIDAAVHAGGERVAGRAARAQ